MEEVGRRPPGSFLRMVKKPRKTLPRVSPVSCKGTELSPPSALRPHRHGQHKTWHWEHGEPKPKAQFPAPLQGALLVTQHLMDVQGDPKEEPREFRQEESGAAVCVCVQP